MPIKARDKGIAFEQRLAKTFREKGWTECLTSRHESKRLDDLGVDLCNTEPFYVQAKAVENLGSAHKVLKSMPKGNMLNVLFHKKNNQGVCVSMSEESFWALVAMVELK